MPLDPASQIHRHQPLGALAFFVRKTRQGEVNHLADALPRDPVILGDVFELAAREAFFEDLAVTPADREGIGFAGVHVSLLACKDSDF